MLPQKVSCTCGQGFVGKYDLNASRGGDFPNKPFWLDLVAQKAWDVPLQQNYCLLFQVGMQTNRCSYKGMVVDITERLQPKEKGCQVEVFSFDCNDDYDSMV